MPAENESTPEKKGEPENDNNIDDNNIDDNNIDDNSIDDNSIDDNSIDDNNIDDKNEETIIGRTFKRIMQGKNPYLVFGAVFLMLHILFDPVKNDNMSIFMLLLMFCMIALSIPLLIKKQLTYDRAAVLIMMIGLMVRIIYVLNTPALVRQHDLAPDNYGQMDYILHFVNSWSLPDTNLIQFYHPPLHHMICAIWFRISAFFNVEHDTIIESFQYLTAFYSSCLMVVTYRIFIHLKLKKQFLLVATALVAFHPTMVILAGSINNDMLAILFYVSAFLWMLRWWEEQSIKNTVLLALCVGLGMMVKIGNATLAFVIAPFFLYKLIKENQWASRLKLATKFLIFGCISIPLGLWHAIRNLIEFGQPLGFVLEQQVGGWLDRGDVPLFSRIFSFPLEQLVASPYVVLKTDYSLPIYTVKCSLFGEWSYTNMDFLAIALVALNIILIAMSLIAMVYTLVRKQKTEYWMLFALWLVHIVSHVFFYIRYPFACSMDFRYIVPTLICGAGFICIAGQRLAEEREGLWKIIRLAVSAPIILFIVLSTCFMLMM